MATVTLEVLKEDMLKYKNTLVFVGAEINSLNSEFLKLN